MEALSQLLFKARCGGFIEGFKVGASRGERRDLLHLPFADDTLIFYEANSDQLRYLSWVFLWFEVISSLKVKKDKSEVIPVGRIESLEDVVSVTGCRIGKFPTSYLGLSLSAPFKSSRVWDVVEERFKKILSLWKRQSNISLRGGGRGGGRAEAYLDKKNSIKSPNLFCISLSFQERCAQGLKIFKRTSCGAVVP